MNRISPKVLSTLLLCVVAATTTTGVLAMRRTLPTAPPLRSAGESPEPAVVKGVVTYLETVTLDPGALLVVQLLDMSGANASAVVLDEQLILLVGRLAPFEFEILCDSVFMQAQGLYGVSAFIEVDGTRIFQGATARVRANPKSLETVELMLFKVGPWSALDLALSSGSLARSAR